MDAAGGCISWSGGRAMLNNLDREEAKSVGVIGIGVGTATMGRICRATSWINWSARKCWN